MSGEAASLRVKVCTRQRMLPVITISVPDIQRQRVSPEHGVAEDDDYVPYVPVKERKKAEVGDMYFVRYCADPHPQ